MLHDTAKRRLRGILPFLLAAVLGASSCARTNPQSLLIRGNVFVNSGSGCEFAVAGNESGPFRTRGVVDLALADTYWMLPTVENLLPAVEAIGSAPVNKTQLHNEDHNVTVTGAILNYQLNDISVQAAGVPSDLFVHSTLVVPPEKLASIPIEAIPGSVGSRLIQHTRLGTRGQAAEMLVKVILEGHTQGGHVLHSNEFVYPLTVCNGCLPFNPPGTRCTSLDPEPDEVPCIFGQDEKLDCRVCMLVYGDRMLCDWSFRNCVAEKTVDLGTEEAAMAACRDLLGAIKYVMPPQ